MEILALGFGMTPMGRGCVYDVGGAGESVGSAVHFGCIGTAWGGRAVVQGKQLSKKEVMKHGTSSPHGANGEGDEDLAWPQEVLDNFVSRETGSVVGVT